MVCIPPTFQGPCSFLSTIARHGFGQLASSRQLITEESLRLDSGPLDKFGFGRQQLKTGRIDLPSCEFTRSCREGFCKAIGGEITQVKLINSKDVV